MGRRILGSSADEELQGLRKEIQRIDRDIVRMMGARQKAARAIGKVKARAGRPIRDFRTEKEVRARAANQGRRLGLDPTLVDSVVSALIESAVQAQEAIQDTSYEGELRRVLIVGGHGKMGRWLARFFHGQGHSVATLDPAGRLAPFPDAGSLEEGVEWADVILLATPLQTARETLRETLALHPRGLVADIFSLKSMVAEQIRDGVSAGSRLASIHPLFGPDALLLAGRTMLICDTGDPAASTEVRAFFTPTSLSIREVSLESHDRMMSIVLGLSHAINAIFSQALLDSGCSFAELQEFGSTTFTKQTRTAAELAAENPVLYHAIQRENPATASTLELILNATRDFSEAALAPDPNRFVEAMKRTRAWYEEAQSAPKTRRRKAAARPRRKRT